MSTLEHLKRERATQLEAELQIVADAAKGQQRLKIIRKEIARLTRAIVRAQDAADAQASYAAGLTNSGKDTLL